MTHNYALGTLLQTAYEMGHPITLVPDQRGALKEIKIGLDSFYVGHLCNEEAFYVSLPWFLERAVRLKIAKEIENGK